MEQLKDPGVILGGIDLIAIGVVYAHLQKQISSLKQQGVKAEGVDDILKNIAIMDKNIKALNNQNVILLEQFNKLSQRVDKLESSNKMVSKGDSKSTKKKVLQKEVSSEEEDDPEQTDEDLVVSMAKKRIQNKSPG
jgi:hypothetical protein